MSIQRIFHCDGPDCERHVRTMARRPLSGFIFVTAGGSSLHFCTWDCVMKYAAAQTPTEIIEA